MSHTSISAEDSKPATGRLVLLQKINTLPLFPNTQLFFFFYKAPTKRIPNSQIVYVTIPITLVLFWILFIHKFQEFCEKKLYLN